MEGQGSVVFKDGSHGIHTTWSLFSYSSDTVKLTEPPKDRDVYFADCLYLVHFLKWVLNGC